MPHKHNELTDIKRLHLISPDMNLRDKCNIRTLKGILLSLLSESSLCLFGSPASAFDIVWNRNDLVLTTNH